MGYKVKRIHNGKATYIEDKCGNLQWRDSDDALGMEFSFDFPHSYFDENYKEELSEGDTVVIFYNEIEILRGIITKVPIGGETYSGYDYAFYLNKSVDIFQFKKMSAEKAIKQICARYDIPVGQIPKMATLINKVYKAKEVSEIIEDILKKVKNETGQRYRMEMQKGKFCIIKDADIKIKPKYYDRTGALISCTKSAAINGERNIEELRNRIVVAGSDEKKTQIKEIAKSESSIKKYGLLSAVETEEKMTEAKARNIGKNKLKELNKVRISFTADMIGSYSARAGRLLYFDRPEVGIKGWFKIKSCTHTISRGMHLMSCEMEG